MLREALVFFVLDPSDRSTADVLSAALEQMRIHAFVRPLSGGADDLLDNDALVALKAADAVVLLFSSSSAQSQRVKRHLIVARQLRKEVIPVRLEHVPEGLLAEQLLGSTWVEWSFRGFVAEAVAARIGSTAAAGSAAVSDSEPQLGHPTVHVVSLPPAEAPATDDHRSQLARSGSEATAEATEGRSSWWLLGLITVGLLVAGVFLFRGRSPAPVAPTVVASRPVYERDGKAEPPSSVIPIRTHSRDEQLVAAFATAFGQDGRAVRTVGEASITFTPGSIHWIGDRAVLLSPGTDETRCHNCMGTIAVHYLIADGSGFRLAGTWLDGGGTAPSGAPPQYRVTTNFDSRPLLYEEASDYQSGIGTSWATLIEFGASGPRDVAHILTGCENRGTDDDTDATPVRVTGSITNIVKGRSFDVVFSGSYSGTEHYEYRGSAWQRTSPELFSEECQLLS